MSRLITYAGRNDETGDLMFVCPSFTDPELIYEIVVNKEQSVVSCDCMDCVCRKHQWHLFADNPDICKHLRVFREFAVPFFKEVGIL